MKNKVRVGGKTAALLMCAMLALQPLGQPVFAKDVTVTVDGVAQTDLKAPFNEKGYFVMDGKTLAKILKLQAQWNPEDSTLALSSGDKKALFTDGNTSYTVNGEKRYMPVTAKTDGDTLLLPIRQVCEAFGAKVSWNATSRTVGISTAAEEASKTMANQILAIPSKTGARKISYNDALAIIIANNSNINDLIDSMKLTDQRHDDYTDAYKAADAVLDTTKRVQGSDEFIAWLQIFTRLDIAKSQTTLWQEFQKVTCEGMLRTFVMQIKTMEMDVVLMKESVALAQTNWNNVVKKNTVGMASDSELRIAKQDLDQAEIRLNTLELGVQSQRLGLNQILHVGANDVVEVIHSPSIVSLTTDIDSHVLGRIKDDPRIKIYEEDLRLAEYELRLFDEVSSSDEASKIQVENDVKSAQRALDDARSDMEKNIRAAYFTLKTLTESQTALAIDLQKAKDAYNNMLVNYEAGLVTMYEVEQAKVGILNIEVDMSKNVYTFDTQHYCFQHPFLLGVLSAS